MRFNQKVIKAQLPINAIGNFLKRFEKGILNWQEQIYNRFLSDKI
jgi:hypothetical protein